MRAVWSVLRELTGLFVDDGALAVTIATVILLAGICSRLMPDASWVTGGILLFGCLGVLFVNVVRAVQR